MNDKITKLECILEEISEAISQKIEIGEIDLVEFDKLEQPTFVSKEDFEKYINEFRLAIIDQKNNPIRTSESIVRLKNILEDSLKYINSLIDTATSKPIYTSDKGTPSKRFLALLNKKIIDTNTIITGEYKGKLVAGTINESGYFEVNIENQKKEFNSPRKAAKELLNYSTQKDSLGFWKVNGVSLKELENQIYL